MAAYATSRLPRSPGARLSSPISGIHALRSAVLELREELTAIRDCLADAELLRTETFLAQLHRRRFAATRKNHPFESTYSLPAVLNSNELLGLTALHSAGIGAVHTLGGTSRGMYAAVQVVTRSLQEVFTRVYICGGADGTQALSSTERFNASSGVWEVLPSMSCARAAAAAAVIGGRWYVCGGMRGDQVLTSVERFTPATCLWEPMPPLLLARADAAAGTLRGRLCVCGGTVAAATHAVTSSVEAFSFELGVWEVLRPLLQPRAEATSGTVAGHLVICGGHHRLQEALDSVECLSEIAGTSQLLAPLQQRRYGAAGIVFQQSLFVYGGHDGRQFLDSAERFDPATGVWEVVAPLSRPRAGSAGTVAMGRIYVCGGYDGHRALAIADRCTDPIKGSRSGGVVWETLRPLAHGRASAVAACLLG